MTQNTKQIIIAVIIIIIAFFAFKMFFVNDESDTLVADQAGKAEFVDGQIILALLNNLKKVTLDDSIFSDKTFISLVRFGKPLEPQISGRQNPFLPIGVDNLGQTTAGTSTPPALPSRVR